MQKIILLTGAILMVSTVANACGGITITGKSGASYCLSKHKMNWFSAYAWCNDQKMSLIDIESVCKNYNSCPEFKFSSSEKAYITDNGGTLGWMWTKTLPSAGNAFQVNFDGSVSSIYGGALAYDKIPALCH